MKIPLMKKYSSMKTEVENVWVVQLNYMENNMSENIIKIFKYKCQAEEYLYSLLHKKILDTGEGTLKNLVNNFNFSYRMFEEPILIQKKEEND